jgi:chromosome segregation ATPase
MTAKRTRTPTPSNNAAEAFDELRNQVSLLHAAIEGLTAAKDKLPDYSPTLRKIEARLDRIDQHIESIHDKPAMRLTPLTLAAESHEASRAYGAEDRKSVGEARAELARLLGRVEGMIRQRRSTEEQDWWITWAGTGGLLFGFLLAFMGIAIFR